MLLACEPLARVCVRGGTERNQIAAIYNQSTIYKQPNCMTPGLQRAEVAYWKMQRLQICDLQNILHSLVAHMRPADYVLDVLGFATTGRVALMWSRCVVVCFRVVVLDHHRDDVR